MALDPRTFSVKPCPAQAKKRSTAVARKKSFLDNITNLGNLEVLNDIGFGKVGKGLRVLSAVSDSVRVGKSAVPGREGQDTVNSTLGKITNTALNAVSEGAETVLDTVGLGGAVDAVGSLNAGVANRAYGQAKDIYKRVKQGNFKLTDIPEVFSDLQNLETLTRGIFGGSSSAEAPRRELCGATPYAMDLIAFAPKFQFMFIVEVHFSSPYSDWTEIGSKMAFVVKTSSRPKFNVEYEDINMYGFRSRVPKRVEYPPMAMSFYDDNKNAAHQFYVSYMRAMSPIANWKGDSPQDGQLEISGMDYERGPKRSTFTTTSPKTSGHSASLGPLVGDATSILSKIKLFHIFDYGNKMNTYEFMNPRITSFNPSDLTMLESGEGCEYQFDFAYDALSIDHMYDLSKDTGKLKEMTGRHGLRPIDAIYETAATGGADIAGTGEPDGKTTEETAPSEGFLGGFADGLSAAANGITDAFGNIIGGVSDISGKVGGVINDVTGGVADAFDQARGAATGALGQATKGISGAINDSIGAAQKAIGGLGTTVSNAFKAGNSLAQEAKAVNEVFDNGAQLSEAGKKLFGG